MELLLYYDDIEAYLAGNMDEPSIRLFKQRLENDHVLRQEYALYTASLKVAEIMAYDELGNQLTEQQPSRLKPTSFAVRKFLSLAAGVLFLVVAGLSWWANTRFGQDELITSNYMAPNLSAVRSTNDGQDPLQTAYMHFYKSEYDQAILILKEVLNNKDASRNATWLLAHVYLKNEQATEAIPLFEEIIASDHPELKYNAQWHLMLACLQLEKEKQAFLILETILSQKDHPYAPKAKRLKNKLESNWRWLCW